MAWYGGQGQLPTLRGVATNVLSLAPGGVSTVVPAGDYVLQLSRYSTLQQQDPITGIWRGIGSSGAGALIEDVYSDGVNYRIANQSGCVVGALLTNAGSGYTSAPTVTASAGNSIWRAIVGGAVSTTVTVTNGGVNYTYPPVVQFSTPPTGGIQATGYCALTSGVVTSVTVTDQGAGYTSAPTITFVNDPREGVNGTTVGYNAAAVATLTGAGTVTGLLCLDHGLPQTSLPTLAFSGGGGSSAAATAIGSFAITGIAVSTAGAGLAGTIARVTAEDAFSTTASAYVNPTTQSNLVTTRSADIKTPITGGGVTATGAVIFDGGVYSNVSPTPLVIPTASVVTTAPVVTFTFGGVAGSPTYLTQV